MVTNRLAELWSNFRARPERLRTGARIYAVGDIHGHLDRLQRLHAAIRQDLAIRPTGDVTLVHIGDLIDRGPDSAGVLNHLLGHPVPGATVVTLLGNHEAMLLDALATHDEASAEHWALHGGSASLISWNVPARAPVSAWWTHIPPAHLTFMRGLPRCYVKDGYVFAHAGVRPGTPLAAQLPDDLIWIRDGFLDWPGIMLPETPDAIIVHGHSPRMRPEVRRNRINLDTGAGRGGPLSCAILEGQGVRWMQA